MNRSTRTLLILVAIAIVALVTLTAMARRYENLLRERETTVTLRQGAAATRPGLGLADELEAFLAVRREMRLVIDAEGSPAVEKVRAARDRAIESGPIDRARYDEISAVCRSWREGRLDANSRMARALERRRAEFERTDLGSYETLDR